MPTSGQSAAGGNVRQLSNYNGSSLSAPQALTTSEAAVLTAPASGRYIVKNIILCERSGNASSATIRKYASSLGNSAANNLFTAVALAANETLILDVEDMFLTNGQILAALAADNSRVVMDVNYLVER